MAIRINFPQGAKAFVSPNPATMPLIENLAAADDQIGLSINSEVRSSNDTVMQPTHIIGGKLTSSGTIDFTNGTDPSTGLAGVDADGKKLLFLEFYNSAESSASINVAPGASNPLPFLGAGNDLTLEPGVYVHIRQLKKSSGSAPGSRLPTVGSSAKTIDVTITSGTLLYLAGFGE